MIVANPGTFVSSCQDTSHRTVNFLCNPTIKNPCGSRWIQWIILFPRPIMLHQMIFVFFLSKHQYQCKNLLHFRTRSYCHVFFVTLLTLHLYDMVLYGCFLVLSSLNCFFSYLMLSSAMCTSSHFAFTFVPSPVNEFVFVFFAFPSAVQIAVCGTNASSQWMGRMGIGSFPNKSS